MKHYQMIEGACACKLFCQKCRSLLDPRIKWLHGESAKWQESIKDEERFKDR